MASATSSVNSQNKENNRDKTKRGTFWFSSVSLGWEDPLEEDKATHSTIPAWRIPWTEEPGELQSIGSQRVRHDWSDLTHARTYWIQAIWRRFVISLNLSKLWFVFFPQMRIACNWRVSCSAGHRVGLELGECCDSTRDWPALLPISPSGTLLALCKPGEPLG